jgi:hypothetical protein
MRRCNGAKGGDQNDIEEKGAVDPRREFDACALNVVELNQRSSSILDPPEGTPNKEPKG